MKIKDYIYPQLIYKSLKETLVEFNHFNRYKRVLIELQEDGKLVSIGIKKEKDNMFIGINLNPELLMYTEDSQESVELKFISEKMKKYTNFLQEELILDVVEAQYERVATTEFYGYVVKISYDFRKYNKSKFIYDIVYSLITSTIAGIGVYTTILGLVSA